MRPCKIKNLMRFQSLLFYIGFAVYSVMCVMHVFSKCNPPGISFVAHLLACAERNENRENQSGGGIAISEGPLGGDYKGRSDICNF